MKTELRHTATAIGLVQSQMCFVLQQIVWPIEYISQVPAVMVIYIQSMFKGHMSMMVMWHASDIIGCDRRRSELPSAPLDMVYANNRTDGQQENRGPTTGQRNSPLNIQHNL